MTEEQQVHNEEPTKEAADSEIVSELHQLGAQLAAAVRGLWESEESRQLRRELGEGFNELGHQLDSAMRTAQESEAAKQFSVQVKETMDRARESDVVGQLKTELVAGLRQLNAHLSGMVESMESGDAGRAESKPEPVDETEV